jgi:hypothetical protein
MGRKWGCGKYMMRMGISSILTIGSKELEPDVMMDRLVLLLVEEHVLGMVELLNGFMRIKGFLLEALANMSLCKRDYKEQKPN